jgi:hypothetical protein
MSSNGSPTIDVGIIDSSTINAISNLIDKFGFSKAQLIILAAIIVLGMNIKNILLHLQQVRTIKNDFKLKNKKLDAKIEAELEKRSRRSLKGKP